MPIYHISINNEPAICNALPGNCPRGTEAVHYKTKKDAAAACHKKNKSEAGAQTLSKADMLAQLENIIVFTPEEALEKVLNGERSTELFAALLSDRDASFAAIKAMSDMTPPPELIKAAADSPSYAYRMLTECENVPNTPELMIRAVGCLSDPLDLLKKVPGAADIPEIVSMIINNNSERAYRVVTETSAKPTAEIWYTIAKCPHRSADAIINMPETADLPQLLHGVLYSSSASLRLLKSNKMPEAAPKLIEAIVESPHLSLQAVKSVPELTGNDPLIIDSLAQEPQCAYEALKSGLVKPDKKLWKSISEASYFAAFAILRIPGASEKPELWETVLKSPLDIYILLADSKYANDPRLISVLSKNPKDAFRALEKIPGLKENCPVELFDAAKKYDAIELKKLFKKKD